MNLFACENKEAVLNELVRRHQNICFCGRPGKYFGYCTLHVKPDLKELYLERHLLEKQALDTYKSINNDTQNPSTIPERMKAVTGNKTCVQFTKIIQGKETGFIFCEVTAMEARP